MEADLVYYKRRSAEEAKAAAGALDERVREVHVELARRYCERVAWLETQSLQFRLTLVSAA